MNRHRFNTILKDPSKVDNNDIRQLNEYRKKYPYFQSLYVVVAKALKDRNHPKTDAFIKKAAIYSANRAHLKDIIEGDLVFTQVEQTKPAPSQNQPEKASTETKNNPKESAPTQVPLPQQTKEEEKKEAPQAEVPENKEAEVNEVITTKEKVIQNKEEPKQIKKEEAAEVKSGSDKKEHPKANSESAPKKARKSSKPKEEHLEYHPDLHELAATKSRIEALLRGEVPEEDPIEHKKEVDEIQAKINSKIESETGEKVIKPKKGKKPLKTSQIEIIEKFIAEDPRIDIKNKIASESEQVQVDLAEKNLKGTDEFITETMALLMVKQGKIKKAVDIYQKLGLKFPEKSTYFATQIQKVKSKHNV